jgi:hypothetical protein
MHPRDANMLLRWPWALRQHTDTDEQPCTLALVQIYFNAKKPMQTKDDQEIYDIVEAHESQAAAWFREFCEPGPDGSLSRSVAKPKLPMPMRLGQLDEPAFLKRDQTPTTESIFMGAHVARVALRSQYDAPGYIAQAASLTRGFQAVAQIN